MRLRKGERVSTLAPVVEQPNGEEEGDAADIAVGLADPVEPEEPPLRTSSSG
jgi:hypothetical protein